MLHFPDDSQSQHKSSYKRRSNGALFVVLGVFLGMYANDNLTNSLKDIQKTLISKSVSYYDKNKPILFGYTIHIPRVVGVIF